jgi:hypothetical protein
MKKLTATLCLTVALLFGCAGVCKSATTLKCDIVHKYPGGKEFLTRNMVNLKVDQERSIITYIHTASPNEVVVFKKILNNKFSIMGISVSGNDSSPEYFQGMDFITINKENLRVFKDSNGIILRDGKWQYFSASYMELQCKRKFN